LQPSTQQKPKTANLKGDGYRRVHVLLRREGWEINRKRTHRIYNELGLQLRNKTPKRRVKAKLREDRSAASRMNDVWAMDFVHDQLATGRKIRVLTVVDTFSRFSPVLDSRFSYCGEDVVQTLEGTCAVVGYPKTIRVDQGSEFIRRDLDLCREGSMLRSKPIMPKPTLPFAIAWLVRSARRRQPGATRPCVPGKKQRGRTSTQESRATGPTLLQSCCSGVYPNPPARPSHEREYDTQPRGASDRELLELRSRGRCDAALWNEDQPHVAIGNKPPITLMNPGDAPSPAP
jgi:hypothetical protein